MSMRYREKCPATEGLIDQPVLFCPYCGAALAEVAALHGQLVLELRTHDNRTTFWWSFALVERGRQRQLTVSDTTGHKYLPVVTAHWASPSIAVEVAGDGGTPLVDVPAGELIQKAAAGDETIEVRLQ
jgi:hypothetical protein